MSESTTAVENYFIVLDRQSRPWCEMSAERNVLLGYAENEDGKIPYKVPDMPASSNGVINFGKPRKEQVWKREPTPHCWSPEHIHQVATEKFMERVGKSRQLQPNIDWHRDEENLSEEQYQYAAREWSRRLNGVWIMINDVPTYITGPHYYYLQHFRIDNGYPKYRDRDRRWFYAWQAVVENPFCYGMIYLKHRRDGATYRCCAVGLEIVTRGDIKGKHFGLTSKSEEDARDAFQDKVIEPWKELVPFFSPMTPSGTEPKGALEFNEPSRPGVDRYKSKNKGIAAWIKYRAKSKPGVVPFDGAKLYFSLNDEAGKRRDEDLLALHRLLLQSMRIDGKLGKMLYPSTNEDLEGSDNIDKFKTLWDTSDPSLRLKLETMATTSKLFRYFTPAYDGFEEQWFGPFGESIVDCPTPEQQEYLTNAGFGDYKPFWDKGWGAYEWCRAERENAEDKTSTKRLIPFTPEDSFRPANPDCYFNLDNLNSMRDALLEPDFDDDGKPVNVLRKLTVTGRLEWVDKKEKLGDVYFVEDSRGPFVFNRRYMPGGDLAAELGIIANNVVRKTYGKKLEILNGHGCHIKIGFDPTKLDAELSTGHKSGRSKAGGHGFYGYNPAYENDPWDQSVAGFSKNFKTHAGIFEYLILPKVVEDTHEDMLKACIFLNAKFHSEKQVPRVLSYFNEQGCGGLLFRNIALNGVSRESGTVSAGQQADELTEIVGTDRIQELIEHHPYVNRFPFIRTIDQLIEYKKTNVRKLDLKVALSWALMAVQPGEVPSHKTAQKAVHTVKEKPNFGKWADSMVGLTSGYGL